MVRPPGKGTLHVKRKCSHAADVQCIYDVLRQYAQADFVTSLIAKGAMHHHGIDGQHAFAPTVFSNGHGVCKKAPLCATAFLLRQTAMII